MLYPSIDKLLTKVDSKYALVVATAKRARKLQDANMNVPGSSTTMNVSRALWEIADGVIRYERAQTS
ncbi:DNA-directed RNA polymerase subunit omega [Alicyclobacillus tolerans]|uniref:DNA-directed RNA polymerase subunit omega n=2 Tax=Alicyclobacillus tolerans TaxID=90970 RepID=A0ABT9LW10_9BACL|nr:MULTISPECIES: DNA-directed RNA polymerase subunit omega [Alicyclobacillus]MDP9728427.1 DNA-directed RNA polymerase subunit omega [Alicyclobacillus tengchongensis]QRF23783.1 DNA-directed RNA polymerase subunit omega [Alicyclobacillus sp. TC]SHK16292.1 DNA-directed RNA polymerase subunit omega [Alicyclobacillus montanus]